MDTDKRVLVSADKAARCGWCGSYESEKWKHDIFRSSIWCSKRCYWAGHFGELACSTIVILTFDFWLISLQLSSSLPLTLNTVLLFTFLLTLTALTGIASYVGYSNRNKIPKIGG